MRNWDNKDDDNIHGCEWEKDFEIVKLNCKKIGIPQPQLINLSNDYWHDVFQPSLNYWSVGKTPNPDIWCNKHIKFGKLLDISLKSKDDYLATGHYARISYDQWSKEWKLQRALDKTKDQSYYLSQINKSVLRNLIFPLGTLIKRTHVRALAHELGLVNADREESMGVCFIGEKQNFGNWLNEYMPNQPGEFVTIDGKSLGNHRGLHHYTIGQKAKISGMANKMFVAEKNVNNGNILVVEGSHHPKLKCVELVTEFDVNWLINKPQNNSTFNAKAQVRHRQDESDCCVTILNDKQLNVKFKPFEMAVAPGQTIAIYDEYTSTLIASATIKSTTTQQ